MDSYTVTVMWFDLIDLAQISQTNKMCNQKEGGQTTEYKTESETTHM